MFRSLAPQRVPLSPPSPGDFTERVLRHILRLLEAALERRGVRWRFGLRNTNRHRTSSVVGYRPLVAARGQISRLGVLAEGGTAAVNGHDSAGDETRVIGQKVVHHGGDLLASADALERV